MKSKLLRVLLPALILLLCAGERPALGQEEAHAAAALLPQGNPSVWQQQGAKVLGLTVLLVGVGYAVVWRSTRRGQNRQDDIRVVSVKALGPKEKVAILEMAGSRMVQGVTARNITLLYREPEAAPPAGGDKEREDSHGRGSRDRPPRHGDGHGPRCCPCPWCSCLRRTWGQRTPCGWSWPTRKATRAPSRSC